MDVRSVHWTFSLRAAADRAGLEPGMSYARGVLTALVAGDGAVTEPWRDDVLLVVCELLANACRHTPGPTRLDFDHEGGSGRGRLTVAVTDPSPVPPRRRPLDPARANGHGLRIVERLADRWGVRAVPGGKTVWATLSLPSPRRLGPAGLGGPV
ncbi:ATP-binding protein [Streptomyces sp. NPDC097619]|uniref:ATP-binding protein n=1 Tax=Streptomyces sp. NPDC097619 TaxID=3157228 RepID=UPI003324D636